MSRLFEDIFPIIDISENKLLNKDDLVSIAFSIQYPDVFLQSKEYYKTLHDNLRSFISLLPEFTILQSLSLFDENNYTPDTSGSLDFLKRSNALYYFDRAVPTQSDYLIFTIGQKPLKSSIDNHSYFKTFNFLKPHPYKNLEQTIQTIDRTINTIETSLSNIYEQCIIKRLKNHEILTLLYRYSSLCYNSNPKNLNLPSIDFKKGLVGDEYFKIFSLQNGKAFTIGKICNQTPSSNVGVSMGQPAVLGNIIQSHVFPLTIGLPFKHAFSTIIQKLNRNKVMKKLLFEEKMLEIPSAFGYQLAKNKLEKIQVYKELVDEMDYQPVYTCSTLVVSSNNKKDLENKAQAVKIACEKNFSLQAVEQEDEKPLLFLSTMPGNANQMYRFELTTDAHSVCMLPKESHYKSDKKGILFSDRYGKPFLLNILDNPNMTNKNGIVIGPSGRGKSFTLNYLVSQFYNYGHLVIIDKGNSYKNLCEILGGTYYNSSQSEKFRFAIFETTKNKDGAYIIEPIQVNFILSILQFIWKQGSTTSNEEKIILKTFIYDYYKYINKDKKPPSLKGFVNYIQNNLKKYNEYDEFFNFKSFFLLLRPYTIGDEKELLNTTSDIDISNIQLTVFEMGSLEKSNPMKFQLLCLIITFLNIKKIQKLPREIFKSFIIDEALSFLKSDIGAFIGSLFAEVRKENGQVLVVAQGIQFLQEASSEVQQKIFSNRDFIVMTNHSGYENNFPKYQELLGFKNHDLELLASVNKNSEVFIRLGDYPIIVKIDVSGEEYGAFSTSPKDMKTIKDLEKHYGSIQTAISAYANKIRNRQ